MFLGVKRLIHFFLNYFITCSGHKSACRYSSNYFTDSAEFVEGRKILIPQNPEHQLAGKETVLQSEPLYVEPNAEVYLVNGLLSS